MTLHLNTARSPEGVNRCMKLSKRTDYALRAIFTLVEEYPGKPISIRELARVNRVPKRFLEQILLDMKTQGWIESYAGKFGGYRLARDPSGITMGEIVRFFDGILAPIGCVSISKHEPCTQARVCRFRRLMLRVRNVVADIMDKTTLANLYAESIVASDELMNQKFFGGEGI